MKNIKANRTFTVWRKYGWILTFLIAFGGLFEHKLGLLVPFGVMLGLMITSLLMVDFGVEMSVHMDVGSIVFCLDILKIKKFQEDLKVK